MALNTSVKNIDEAYLYHCYEDTEGIRVHRTVGVTGDAAGTETAGVAIPVTGKKILAVVTQPIQGSSLVLQVAGTDADGATTGDVTFPANSNKEIAMRVLNSNADKVWLTVTGVTVVVSGISGEEVEIISVPDTDNFSAAGCFVKNVSWNPGETSRAVRCRFEPVDHNKRIPGNPTFNIGSVYQAGDIGIANTSERDMVIKLDIRPDDGPIITEKMYFETVRGVVNTDMPENADATCSFAGRYNRRICVVNPSTP